MSAMHPRTNNPAKAILTAWLAAGSFDILAAFMYSIVNGGSALGVARAVASGLLGTNVIGAGWDIGLIGLALHYAIMLGIVLVFWGASRYFAFLLARPFIIGPLYGVAVYAVMNLVVLPLSAIAFKPNYSMAPLLIGIATHMICVGLPIAFVFHYYSRRS
jgi:hypothetical protein